jgi:hypothetical protein
MTSLINADSGVTSGLTAIIKTADSSGEMTLQTNGSNALTINSIQNITANSTGSITMPVGTTAQRPSTPVDGMLRYNTTISNMEIYINSSWVTLT